MTADAPVFDLPDEQSPFLSFVREEFKERSRERWVRMGDKMTVSSYLKPYWIELPRRLLTLEQIDELNPRDLPEIFVLKFAQGWSARGVMLLEWMGKEFFCHLVQRTYTREQIIHRQKEIASSFGALDARWIVEEPVPSTIPGKPIPLDYKFYCFRDQIGMIGQFDRNTYPVKVSLMDGNFASLAHKKDYILGTQNAQFGVPVVPLHARVMIEMARTLACTTESPFVSVDLYDSPSGPIFGEFTFAPGGTHKRMWVYSREYIAQLDALFEEALRKLKVGDTGPPQPSCPVTSMDHARIYGALASAALNGSSRAQERLSSFFADSQGDAELAAACMANRALLRQRLTNNFSDRASFRQRMT